MAKRKFQRCLLFIVTYFFFSLTFAQTSEQSSPFSPSKWNKSVDSIEEKLTTTPWTLDRISYTLDVITDLQKNAKECIRYSQAELDKINLAATQPVGAGANQASLPATTFSYKEAELNELRGECRLFLFHSQDIYTEVENLRQHLLANEIFSKSPSIFETAKHLPSLFTVLARTNTDILFQEFGLEYLTVVNSLMLGFFIFLGVALGSFLATYGKRKLLYLKKNSLRYTALVTALHYTYPLSLSVVLAIFLIALSWRNGLIFPAKVCVYFSAYLSILAMIRGIFYPPQAAKPLILLPEPIPRELNLRLFYLTSIIFAFYLMNAFFIGQNFPIAFFELGMSVYITLLSTAVVSIVWLIMRFPAMVALPRSFRLILDIFFAVILAIILFSEWLGFHFFSIFLIKNIALSFIFFCLALMLHMIVIAQISQLKNQQKLHYYLGLRLNRSIPELDILQGATLTIIWGGLLAFLLKLWALSESYYSQLMLAMEEGFTVIGLTFIPSRILFALFVFVLLALGNRLLQAYVSRHSRYYVEDGTQVAMASIVGYAGFTLSLIIVLVIAGVNFTGLAIIAGALSVGIGFGLQNIANNFISGLILLLDNPIRPGDRIQVGEIEGIVKRIRLRATHIYTSRHADVFIPNSELISKSVTNFVFHDKTWNLVCTVAVEYGCDIALVKALLLEVAAKHPEVIQEGDKMPQVFFKKFADSALLFELSCLIRDVGKKANIESDLNYAIYEAFNAHHIAFPFPQQDVHIKAWPEKPIVD